MPAPGDVAAEFLFAPRADWMARASCRDKGLTDTFFMDRGEKSQAALEYCARCEVRKDCLQYALDNDLHHGIWGGLSVRARRDPDCVNREVKVPTLRLIGEMWEKGWRHRAIARELGISEGHVRSALVRYRKARNGF